MKKMLALLLTLCLLAGMVPLGAGATEDKSCTGGDTCDHAAAIGDTHYDTLVDAVKAVQDSTATTIKLLKNVDNGDGIIIPEDKNITIDFATYTYTVTQNLAGSSGSENQCFQLLENSTVVLKNGAIVGNNNSIKMMVQNYSNLTLESMSLDATKGTNSISYVSSNNCGKVFVTGNTTITAKGTGKAFDVSYWPSAYPDGTQVEINTTGTITGDIEIGLYGANGSITLPSQSVLSVKNVNLVGNITTLNTTSGKYNTGLSDEEAKKAFADKMTISGGTFSSNVSQYTEEGYTAVQKDGKYVVEKLDATNAIARVGEKYFSSLEGAWTYALQQKTATIILHKNVTGQSKLTMDQGNTSITLDLNGHDIGFAKNCNFSIYQGKLDIIGTGTIEEEKPYYGPVMLYGSDTDVSNYTVLSVGENVTLKGWSGLFIDQLKTNSNGANAFGIVATVHGTLSSVKDTTGVGGHALYINGTIKATSGNVPKITLDGATLTTVQGNGMYLAGYAETKITDSVITSASEGSTGIEIRAGKLEITNSTVTGGNGTYTGKPNGNGSTSDNVALAVAQHTTKLPIDVTIHSGTFTANAAFIEANPQKNTDEYIAKITLNIEGGNFNGLVCSEDKTGFIKNGYFTSDPSEYCAKDLTGVPNTGSNSSTYPFTVGESIVDVETAVAAGEPSVDVLGDISGVTEDAVKKAAQAEATQTSLQDAAKLAGLSNNPSVVGTEEKATHALIDDNVTVAEGATVTVVVQPYLDVAVKSATTTGETNSMTVEISAKYNVIATTADDPEDIELEGNDINATTLDSGKEMKVTSPVTITLPLPNGFVTNVKNNVYVQHENIYEYKADVTSKAEEGSYTATFTNPHGFSTFVLSTESETVATVNDTNYTNFQQAVDDAVPSDIITVKQNNLSATGVTHNLTLTNGAGKEITVTINGTEYTIKKGETLPFTYTPPTPPRPTEEKHSITISTDGKGQVTGPASAAEDDKVTLTVKPGADKELYDLKVTDEDGKAVAVTKVNDTTYTFTMPDGKVTIAATFGCDGGDNCPSKAFTDLGDKQWYHDSIDYAVEHGLLEGTSATTMEPNATLIRAQLAQILYNIEDKPAVTGEMIFEDVPASEWFYSPVLWANQNDIINGTSATTFEPLEAITRQDLALMLYRYAGEPAVTGDLDGFTDADQVGDWAEEAMAWAVAEGIVQGDTPTTLNPTGTATRAEAAAMLQRFLEDAA